MAKIGRNSPCPCGSGAKYKKCCLDRSHNQTALSRDYFRLKGENAEKIVHELAFKSFLVDWCFPNPKLPSGKELCDLLVVFDNIAVIWQIKDLRLGENGRYNEAEVEKNLRQLSGARRQLFELKSPIDLQNNRRGVERFDPNTISEVYLISVLLGEGQEIHSGVESVKNHTAHVFTREFTHLVLTELDTIADFTEYLRSKEALINSNTKVIIEGGEEELLALYLLEGRNFTRFKELNELFVQSGHWTGLQSRAEYKVKKSEDEISYGWDSIIDSAHDCDAIEYEAIARELARPNRFLRRYLSKIFFDAHVRAHEDQEHDLFRRILPLDGITYCFLLQDDVEPRERRRTMLHAVCFVARGLHRQNHKVLGIATEKVFRPTCAYDFCLLNMPEWTTENQIQFERLQVDFGIFANPSYGSASEKEYPADSEPA